ncbi:MAG: DNA methyltransferase [Persicimonas sp.]
MQYRIHNNDVLDQLREMPDAHFDACFCDPPYGLSFMGRRWDRGVPSTEVWAEVLRVLKPGAPLMAFGGTRMWHRLAVNIEDAGFEIRDTCMWLYGSGFPKAHDVSKAIDKKAGAERRVVGRRVRRGDNGTYESRGSSMFAGDKTGNVTTPATPAARKFDGYKSAIKPAWEPIVWAMKPLDGTYADNALTHGVAGLNVDAGRIGVADGQYAQKCASVVGLGSNRNGSACSEWSGERENSEHEQGRYPANLVLDERAAERLDRQTGDVRSAGDYPSNSTGTGSGVTYPGKRKQGQLYGDSGGASRFFYTAKASRAEREAGLFGFDTDTTDDGRNTPIDNPYQRGETERRNTHPTVKPVDLCRYFSAMLLPPERDTPRRVLTPFSGVGSEMIGHLLAGWDACIGIEINAEYIEIAKARIAWWREHGEDAVKAHKLERKRTEQNDTTGQIDWVDKETA